MKKELGISTFGETTILEHSQQMYTHDERIRQLVQEIELADKVGLDIYAIGEHHRDDFAVSAPEVVLAAGAVNTKHIRLSTAVTVLSSQDPIRVYQQHATVDALSNGRAEIMVGRGSFIESFPLFGYDLKDYEQLFDEKLEMLLQIRDNELLNWNGNLTQTVDNKGVYPRAVQKQLPIYVGTGGNAESTIKVAQKGLPIAYAIIGGNPMNFKRLVNAYKHIGESSGYNSEQLKVAVHSWGYIADDNAEAIRDYYHPTKISIENIGRDRPHWSNTLSYDSYLHSVSEDGAMFVGDVNTVANKIIHVMEELGLDRFMLHLPIGSLPHEKVLRAIELYGTQVAPKVRAYFENKNNG